MPTITLSGQVINFPDSAASPNWAPAVIQFAQATAGVLNSLSGAFDVPNQTFPIDIYNPGVNIPIPGLAFPTSTVRSASINYSVFRTTNTNTAYEAGTLLVVYNPSNPPGSLWELSIDRVGSGLIVFKVLDTGQVEFTTTTMPGTGHTGKIAFVAQALLKT